MLGSCLEEEKDRERWRRMIGHGDQIKVKSEEFVGVEGVQLGSDMFARL